jgi:hypothetical protein
MACSGGIRLSAVVVFLGSAFAILSGGFAVLGSLAASNARPGTPVPIDFRSVAIGVAIFYLAFGGWGIASGIGLLHTRHWARVSMLVFACLLLLFSLPTAVMMSVIRLPETSDPNLPANFRALMKLAVEMVFGLMAALGGFWLYFFNKRSVKAQFLGVRPASQGMVADVSAEKPKGRPLSITIIAWYLLIASGLSPLLLLFSRTVLHGQTMPVCFLGFFIFRRSAILVLVVWMAAQFVAAIGLLKLRNWGRVTCLWLQVLGIVNLVLTFAVPANRVRYQKIVETMYPQFPQTFSFSALTWMVIVCTAPILLVVLWFLVTQKRVFLDSPEGIRRATPGLT